jgi:peroxiredoxin
VVFLLGEFSPTSERLLKVLSEATDQYLSLDFSPVAVSGESVFELAKYHKQNDVPFLLVSDASYEFHKRLRGDDGEGISVWIVSEESEVIDTVPIMPPTELVNVVLERITRFYRGQKQQEEES